MRYNYLAVRKQSTEELSRFNRLYLSDFKLWSVRYSSSAFSICSETPNAAGIGNGAAETYLPTALALRDLQALWLLWSILICELLPFEW